jgi:hypothetical protein
MYAMRRLICIAAVLSAFAARSGAEEEGSKFISVKLELNGAVFWRGERFPVDKMKATLTVTNTSPAGTPVMLARPEIMTRGGCQVEIKKDGEDKVIQRTEGATPSTAGGSDDQVTLAKKDETLVTVLVPGEYYDIREGGSYSMRMRYMGVWTNSVAFTVLPLKRVAADLDTLEKDIREYEHGDPTYPYMFYIVDTRERHERLVLRLKRTQGARTWYETIGICAVAPRSMPKMKCDGMKAAIVVTDLEGRWFQYQVDMSGENVVTSRAEALKDADPVIGGPPSGGEAKPEPKTEPPAAVEKKAEK